MRKFFVFLMLAFSCLNLNVYSCTDFILKSKDNGCVVGRSMEFGTNLETIITAVPANQTFESPGPNNSEGISWTSKYGYLAFRAFDKYTADGVNEKGLSFGYLWLPGTEYEKIPQGDEDLALAYTDVGDWILGNFATVEEVKKALNQVLIWGFTLKELNIIAPLHITVHDANGQSIVVEFIDGEKKIHDNKVGVLTNAPTFDWHIQNLGNYLNLKAINASDITINGTVLAPSGQGSGLLGIPGDWMPPSRFVRIVTFSNAAEKPKDAKEGVLLAQHLLNTVDIPYGVVKGKLGDPQTYDYTQWVVIKDLTNKITYFRTYEDVNLKRIDMKKIDFGAESQIRTISMNAGAGMKDVTTQLSGTDN